MRILITAGGTREYIDPVRFISNASSGRMGYALARAALRAGMIIAARMLMIAMTTSNSISVNDLRRRMSAFTITPLLEEFGVRPFLADATKPF